MKQTLLKRNALSAGRGQWRRLRSLVLGSLLLAGTSAGFLMAGEKPAEIKIRGVIIERTPDQLTVRDERGREMLVKLSEETEIEEQKRNFLRGAKDYSRQELIPGLDVSVKGISEEGWVVAREIKFTQDALKVARAIFSKVQPIEKSLNESHAALQAVGTRLDRQEGKDEQLSGDVDELKAGLRLTRSQIDEAEDSTKRAFKAIDITNERISSLDSYQVAEEMIVYFPFNSSELTEQEQAKLDELMEKTASRPGYLVEVRGFSSSEGNDAYNRRLSQRRADSVRTYLVETAQVPLRRLVDPFGFGDKHPVADNSSLEGRRKNRRVEVRILVNQALIQDTSGMSAGMVPANPFQ